VKVLERQVKRVPWQPRDRLLLALLRERLPRSAWATLLVQLEAVLGWHREPVRRRWAAYRGRPRVGRPPLALECRELIQGWPGKTRAGVSSGSAARRVG
jgi:putative transposase